MALSSAQVTQVFEVFGVPENGGGDVVSEAVSLFGPVCDSYDLSAIVTKLNARLSALTSSQIDRVTALLERWSAITSSSPLKLAHSGGSQGTIVDHAAERAAIKQALSNITGWAVSGGGFAAEAERGRGNVVSR
jgi:hypothetical protein